MPKYMTCIDPATGEVVLMVRLPYPTKYLEPLMNLVVDLCPGAVFKDEEATNDPS